ncbi:MAG: exodeoxyribonuclease VII large subunit [Clostridiales Family XIII bacterium]|jgi:exodeoxyribonuclease VII large subunit|nr:exodeoxyribonuclease VII large subunit [Clostridiales Family XIII bacterium]
MRPIKVSQINAYIKRILGSDPVLSNVSVSGEISNCRHHSNGHVYFTLKDEYAAINCFLPSTVLGQLRFPIDDGLEVVAHGYVNVYEKGGSYSLNIRNITVEGAGNLAGAFELLKTKLRGEGLFDAAHKRPLPFFPKVIGIVTSPTGAAIEDMIKIITTRNDYADIVLYPSLVQGEGAAAEIAVGIEYFNGIAPDSRSQAVPRPDVILIGRGGGSIEDLWAFNEELLARAVYASEIPVVSAVGHETDVTITDFVADVRAETPTAAAALVAPDTGVVRAELAYRKEKLCGNSRATVAYFREQTGARDVSRLIFTAQNRIDGLRRYARGSVDGLFSAAKSRRRELLHKTELRCERLRASDPSRIMALGYAAVTNEAGTLIRSVAALETGGDVQATFADGTAKMRVASVEAHEL